MSVACLKPNIISCSLCSRTIDGQAVKLGRPPIIEGFHLGICQDCQRDPSCMQCHKHPLNDGAVIVSVEGDDVTNDTRWCIGCIREFQAKGFDVHQTGKRPKRKTPVSGVPAGKNDPALPFKILQGGKGAEDKAWMDDAPVIKSEVKPLPSIPQREIAQRMTVSDETVEEMVSISSLNKRTNRATKAIKRASSAWYQRSE